MSARNNPIAVKELDGALECEERSAAVESARSSSVQTSPTSPPAPSAVVRTVAPQRKWTLRLLSPTIDLDVGAANYNTVASRVLSLEYLFGAVILFSMNMYGFDVLRRFCNDNTTPLFDEVLPPNVLMEYFGARGYDLQLDQTFAAYSNSIWTLATLSVGLGAGSYVCRRLALPAPRTPAASKRTSSSSSEEFCATSPIPHKRNPLSSVKGILLWPTLSMKELTGEPPLNGSPLDRASARSTPLLPLLPLLYTIIGLIFTTVLHGPHFFMPLLLTLANYVVFTRLQRWCPYWLFMTIMWAAHISLLYIIECQKGFEETYWLQYYFPTSIESSYKALGVHGVRKGLWLTRLRWYIAFRMTTLRLIAFNYDLWEATYCAARARERAADKHDTTCIECAQLREQNSSSSGGTALPAEASRCYKYRTECPRDLGDYNFLNYLAYVVFPPLYLAGPMSSFNAFVSYMRVPSTAIPARKMAVYALRTINIYLCLMVLLHYVFIFALSTYTLLILSMNSVQQAHFFFYSLVYIWLKFSFIWKSSRLFAMFSGIEVPEDMRRCLCNTFSVRDFWRDWHASFNLWIVRYMYVPMGGRSRVALSILPIFLFIALWHDPALHLLKWALCIAAMFVVELVVSACFGWVAGVFHREVAAASSTGGDAAGSNVGDEEAGARPSQRSQRGGRVAATVALLLRPAARLTARHMGPRARAWCYRMLRVLGGMSTEFGLIVANLIGFSMQNSEATVEKSDIRTASGDADRSILRSLKNFSGWSVAGLVITMYAFASLAVIDRDYVSHYNTMLKTHFGLK
ncbi:glycerol uptake protein [Lotmaria passim]